MLQGYSDKRDIPIPPYTYLVLSILMLDGNSADTLEYQKFIMHPGYIKCVKD